jgi:hypothetical protein
MENNKQILKRKFIEYFPNSYRKVSTNQQSKDVFTELYETFKQIYQAKFLEIQSRQYQDQINKSEIQNYANSSFHQISEKIQDYFQVDKFDNIQKINERNKEEFIRQMIFDYKEKLYQDLISSIPDLLKYPEFKNQLDYYNRQIIQEVNHHYDILVSKLEKIPEITSQIQKTT